MAETKEIHNTRLLSRPLQLLKNFIPSFAHISDAFYKVSRADEILWTVVLESKFEELKQQLLQPRIVQLSDLERHLIFENESSRVAVGEVLKQRFEDTCLEQAVGIFLRALTVSERKYAAYEIELYAMVRAVEPFRTILISIEFIL